MRYLTKWNIYLLKNKTKTQIKTDLREGEREMSACNGFPSFKKSCGFWDRYKRRLDLELPRFVAMAFYRWFIVVL